MRWIERCGVVEGVEGVRQLPEGMMADAAQEPGSGIGWRGLAGGDDLRKGRGELTPLDQPPRGCDERPRICRLGQRYASGRTPRRP
jgi:hypothetical protein